MTIAGLVGTVVIGAGQAGLALSALLQDAGHPHVVLERGRVGERWRSERWDSLVLLTPDWLNRLPGERPPADPDGFSTGTALADRLDAYASDLVAPVVERVTVLRIESTGLAHRVVTDRGDWLAGSVVDATGDCAVPVIPRVHGDPPVPTLHASTYRAPRSLPPGGVLVVGAGPTGQQLALELAADGRDVVLAVGRHARVPRRIDDRDIWSWLAALGDLDRTIDSAPDPTAARRSPAFPLSGADGGRQLDLAVLQEAGVRLTGRLLGFAGRRALFAADLPASVWDAERRLRRLLDRIEALEPGAASSAGL
ncbi:MAG: NAD(P)-binding domain-containing protein, partial [Gaiella sp.]